MAFRVAGRSPCLLLCAKFRSLSSSPSTTVLYFVLATGGSVYLLAGEGTERARTWAHALASASAFAAVHGGDLVAIAGVGDGPAAAGPGLQQQEGGKQNYGTFAAAFAGHGDDDNGEEKGAGRKRRRQ